MSAKKNLLIIFQKNLIPGKVKTRLARDMGNGPAMNIYRMLISKTFEETLELKVTKWIFYSDYVERDDIWPEQLYSKMAQSDGDLGKRMLTSFKQGFDQGFQRICIIGTDCFDISGVLIQSAFRQLENHDFVIGPATDGGYYLIGMNQLFKPVFQDKKWSTSSILRETLHDIKYHGFSYHMLKTLNDIDTIEDYYAIENLKNNNKYE